MRGVMSPGVSALNHRDTRMRVREAAGRTQLTGPGSEVGVTHRTSSRRRCVANLNVHMKKRIGLLGGPFQGLPRPSAVVENLMVHLGQVPESAELPHGGCSDGGRTASQPGHTSQRSTATALSYPEQPQREAPDGGIPAALASTLEHIVGQLDVLTQNYLESLDSPFNGGWAYDGCGLEVGQWSAFLWLSLTGYLTTYTGEGGPKPSPLMISLHTEVT
ncbi:hypothetical protein NFI96_003553 [Prochilodus magdalenae]|nr:hypothetical protein NFI96_003553 [Prochilodus magdalenae]